MVFEALTLNAGLSVSLALGALAVLWNYSSFPSIRWNEITAGTMAFLAGSGVELLGGSNALGMFTSVGALTQVAAVLYLVGGILVLVGGLVNAVELIQRQYA